MSWYRSIIQSQSRGRTCHVWRGFPELKISRCCSLLLSRKGKPNEPKRRKMKRKASLAFSLMKKVRGMPRETEARTLCAAQFSFCCGESRVTAVGGRVEKWLSFSHGRLDGRQANSASECVQVSLIHEAVQWEELCILSTFKCSCHRKQVDPIQALHLFWNQFYWIESLEVSSSKSLVRAFSSVEFSFYFVILSPLHHFSHPNKDDGKSCLCLNRMTALCRWLPSDLCRLLPVRIVSPLTHTCFPHPILYRLFIG